MKMDKNVFILNPEADKEQQISVEIELKHGDNFAVDITSFRFWYVDFEQLIEENILDSKCLINLGSFISSVGYEMQQLEFMSKTREKKEANLKWVNELRKGERA